MPRRPDPQTFSEAELWVLRQWCGNAWRVSLWDMEFGSVALLYPEGLSWAHYALAREHGRIHVWNSVTLADIGRFPSVRDALAALPSSQHDKLPPPASNVVMFPGRRR